MYSAPIKDLRFVLEQLLDLDALGALPRYADYSADLGAQILEQAGRFATDILDPINAVGDRTGTSIGDAGTVVPPSFRAAYDQYVAAGWQQLGIDTELGGQGAPRALASAVEEILFGANMTFMLCPLLTRGAIDALQIAGSQTLRAQYLPHLISGEWSGTMNLTESQAGSDLGAIRMRAVAQADHYRLYGQKIFITYGEHDLTDNILHLVLARIDGAAAGVKGISLFAVPRFLLVDGTRKPNDVRCLSIERKLGIHASPTCVMSYGEQDGAIGQLVGMAGHGLQYMFIMMNTARLAVGVQGIGLAERARQQASAWARSRVQGHAPADDHGAAATSINHHPDVRRMLLELKSGVEAMRAVALYAALQIDLAQTRAELLIPIVKGWCTEWAVELVSQGMQVHGGMGYIEETGIAQTLRDARITTIYEGTTGIQANDLLGRKLGRDDGTAMHALIAQARHELQQSPQSQETSAALTAVTALETSTHSLVAQLRAAPVAAYAVAVPYLMLAGFTLGGWLMARAARLAAQRLAASDADVRFWQSKLQTTRFYAAQVLPRTLALAATIRDGGSSVAEADPDLI